MLRTGAPALLLLSLAGCSSAEPSPASAVSNDSLATRPACFGKASAIVLSNGLPYASGRVNDVTAGMFLVDLATTRSTIDLAAFDIRPTATGCNSDLLGQSCSFDAFDLLGSWGQVSLVTADESEVHGSVRQAGIVGTDFLSVLAVTLDYTAGSANEAPQSTFCSDATLDAQGFAPLDASGFYASDPSKLKPLSTVIDGAADGDSVPNVPTVPVTIAGTSAVAQLDTGFDDSLVPFSINVNEAFFDAIQKAQPDALVRASSYDLALSTCVGVSENVEAYTLASGVTFSMGSALGTWSHPIVFVKRTPAAARVCGGIGTWSAPAAQIGSAFFKDLGVLVFDPFSSRVWAKKPG